MRILITNRFKKEYLKKLSKYFSIEDFVKDLKQKKHKIILLH
jgi:hypothetical protein